MLPEEAAPPSIALGTRGCICYDRDLSHKRVSSTAQLRSTHRLCRGILPARHHVRVPCLATPHLHQVPRLCLTFGTSRYISDW